MVAFALPVIWAFAGFVGLKQLQGVLMWAGLSGITFENWKLKKCQTLGVDAKTLGLELGEDEARKKLAEELGIESLPGAVIHVFELEDVEGFEELTGKYALVGEEFEHFLDGIRHLQLRAGVGPEAARLKALISGKGLKYEELSFLWDGFGCNFVKFQNLSKVRLEDSEFQRLLQK